MRATRYVFATNIELTWPHTTKLLGWLSSGGESLLCLGCCICTLLRDRGDFLFIVSTNTITKCPYNVLKCCFHKCSPFRIAEKKSFLHSFNHLFQLKRLEDESFQDAEVLAYPLKSSRSYVQDVFAPRPTSPLALTPRSPDSPNSPVPNALSIPNFPISNSNSTISNVSTKYISPQTAFSKTSHVIRPVWSMIRYTSPDV